VIPSVQAWKFRLQSSRIACDVPRIVFFYKESMDCFPSMVSKFFFKLLFTIPEAPIITGIITHFINHILNNNMYWTRNHFR
jgi:hypothetical protein